MKIKRWSIAAGAVIAFIGMPVLSGSPVLANLQQAGESIVEAILGAEVQLKLVAEKKIISVDETGKEVIAWQSLEGQPQVFPGDIVRYHLMSKNAGDQDAQNLVLSQAIPQGTVYVLASANSNNGAEITYSIDNGQSFVANPTIEVEQPDGSIIEQPAPAELYTNVKWEVSQALLPQGDVDVSYEVQIP